MLEPTPNTPPTSGEEPMSNLTGTLFSIYYLGNLVYTYAIKQPWLKVGVLLETEVLACKEQIDECLKQMVQQDGTPLIGDKLDKRVKSLEGLCDALVVNSRASFFESTGGYWNAESVEMLLRWNDDWLEEMLRGWDRPRKDPPTQAARVAAVLQDNEAKGELLLSWARAFRIVYDGLRALGTDFAICRGAKKTVGRKKKFPDSPKERRIISERQKAIKKALRSYEDALWIGDLAANDSLSKELRLLAAKVASDSDKDIKDKASELGIAEHLIEDIVLASQDLYTCLDEQWDRAVLPPWASFLQRLRGLRPHGLAAIFFPGTVFVSEKARRRAQEAYQVLTPGRSLVSWKRMMEPNQLRAFGDGSRKSFIPTEVMERVFESFLLQQVHQTIQCQVSVLEKEIADTKALVGRVSLFAQAVNFKVDQGELRLLDNLIKRLRGALSAAPAESDASAITLFNSIIDELEAARDAVVEAISNARAKQAEAASKSKAEAASDARAEQAGPASISKAQPASNAREKRTLLLDLTKVLAAARDKRAKQAAPPGMVHIPAGKFRSHPGKFRSRRERQSVSSVFVGDFYIDAHLVTCEDFKKFLDENPEWQQHNNPCGDDSDYLLWGWLEEPPRRWRNMYPPGKAKHPVIQVPYAAAKAYAEWKGKRLPTVEEWEKAARGGLENKAYPWGDIIFKNADANQAGSRPNQRKLLMRTKPRLHFTTPVGYYAPNGYGLYDVVGNAPEWCEGLHARGSSCFSYGNQLRIDYDSYELPLPEDMCAMMGFRCVMDVKNVVR